jgi:hypothetical protein
MGVRAPPQRSQALGVRRLLIRISAGDPRRFSSIVAFIDAEFSVRLPLIALPGSTGPAKGGAADSYAASCADAIVA